MPNQQLLDAFLQEQEYRIRHGRWQPHQTFGRALPPRQTLVDAEHGTLICYAKYGCRCLPCKAANAQYKGALRRALRQRQLAALAQRPAKAPARTLAFFRTKRRRREYASVAARRADLRAYREQQEAS